MNLILNIIYRLQYTAQENKITLYLYRLMQPTLRRIFSIFDWLMWQATTDAIDKNLENGFQGAKKGTTLLTAIALVHPSQYLAVALGCKFTANPQEADAILQWGVGFTPYRYAILQQGKKYNLPVILAEDAFIRSIGIGAHNSSCLGIIVDSAGLFYDSRLGCIFDNDLNSSMQLDDTQKLKSQKAMDYLRDYYISKYNMTPPKELEFNKRGEYESVVLVIDQRFGDQSIVGAKANKNSFTRMLNDAIAENPNSLILVKTHPDSKAGYKGYYTSYKPTAPNIRILSDNLNPISLLKTVDKIYVVSSQMGMEGLILGKQVFCYGASFYSGWGLTTDRGAMRERKKNRTLEEVFYVAYMKHSFYYRPDKEERTDIFGLMEYLKNELQKL